MDTEATTTDASKDDDAEAGSPTAAGNTAIATDDAEEQTAARKTRTGRTVKMPERLIEEMKAMANDNGIQLTQAEINDGDAMKELEECGLVGAGRGRGFVNTSELHVLKYNEVMKAGDLAKWDDPVMEEND